MIKVLIIGSGGREHAFTWKASQSELVDKIFVAPGNAGTSLEPNAENIEISASDIESLVSFSKKKNISNLISSFQFLIFGLCHQYDHKQNVQKFHLLLLKIFLNLLIYQFSKI